MSIARGGARVTLGERNYIMDLAGFARRPVPAMREQIDQGAEPGEQSLSNAGIWPRSGKNFNLGAGQDFFDDEESDRRRFSASTSVNPWTKRQLSLLNQVTQQVSASNVSQQVVPAAAALFHRYGSVVRRTTSVDLPSTWVQITTPVGAGVSGITSDGYRVYFNTSTGIYRLTNPYSLTLEQVAATGATYYEGILAYANGRLFASQGPRLDEIAANGTVTEVYTHPLPTFKWKVVVGAPNAIYASGDTDTDGDSEVYFVTVNDTTTALDAPVWATGIPGGERVYAMAFYAGKAILGTTRGVRLANIAGPGFLEYGSVIEVDQNGVRCFDEQGEFVWFGWEAGLGRLNLSQFTDDLVPAYARDLNLGLSNGQTSSIVTWQGRRWFTQNGRGLYVEGTDRAESGTYDSGWITYGVSERKSVAGFELQTDPLEDGQSVIVTLEEPDGTTTTILTHSTLGATEASTEVTGIDADRVKVRLTLVRGTDTTTSPVVRRWTIRSIPMPYPVDEIYLTLLIGDRVTNTSGVSTIAMDSYEEWQYLKGLRDARVRVPLTIGADEDTVTVDAVGIDQGGAVNWNDNATWFNGAVVVKLTTVQTT